MSTLMNERMDDDYNDFLITEFDEIEKFVEPSKEYLAYIENLITKS